MADQTLADALRTITEITRSDSPMAEYITREFNLYLDVLRTEGKRVKMNVADLHVFFTRLHDLAQVQPLDLPETKPAPVDLDKLAQATRPPEVVPFGKPTPLTLSRPAAKTPETKDEP